MSDFFDNFTKTFKNDLAPILAKYFNDPNLKKAENLNDFLNDPQTVLTDFFENISKDKVMDNFQRNPKDIKNDNDNNLIDAEYDELFKRLTLIEDNMIQLEKILKNKN